MQKNIERRVEHSATFFGQGFDKKKRTSPGAGSRILQNPRKFIKFWAQNGNKGCFVLRVWGSLWVHTDIIFNAFEMGISFRRFATWKGWLLAFFSRKVSCRIGWIDIIVSIIFVSESFAIWGWAHDIVQSISDFGGWRVMAWASTHTIFYRRYLVQYSRANFKLRFLFFTAGKTWQAKERFLFLKNWRSTTKPSIKSVHHKISPLSSRSFSNPETLKTFRCQWDVKTSTVSARSHSQLNGIEAHGKYGCLGCPLVIQLGNECPKFSIGHKGIHLQL